MKVFLIILVVAWVVKAVVEFLIHALYDMIMEDKSIDAMIRKEKDDGQ